MARPAVFDPTDPVLFDRQRQRFDWSLLQNGTVFRFDTVFQLDSACTHLNDLDYLVHRIDGHRWSSTADMYDAFAQVLSYDPSYGRGPDAVADALSDVAAYTFGADPAATGTVVAVTGFDTLLRLDRRIAQLTLDSFARQARLAGLYGHPMLCLVHTSATDLGRVGGIEVQRGNVWDAEPDPPQPFEIPDRVEFIVRFFGSEAELADAVAALHSALTETLSAVGRWQMLAPEPAPDPAALPPAHQRAEATDAGRRQLLWQVSIGVRGAGDYTVLGELIYHRARVSGIVFAGTISRIYPIGARYRADFAARFPALGDGAEP